MNKSELKLRRIIRETVLVELTNQSRRLFLNNSENAKAIDEIKAREEENAKVLGKILNTLKYQVQCGGKQNHRFTLSWMRHGNFHFRCIDCDLEYSQTKENLTEKETALVKVVLET